LIQNLQFNNLHSIANVSLHITKHIIEIDFCIHTSQNTNAFFNNKKASHMGSFFFYQLTNYSALAAVVSAAGATVESAIVESLAKESATAAGTVSTGTTSSAAVVSSAFGAPVLALPSQEANEIAATAAKNRTTFFIFLL
jgi:hypothetical protein